MTDHECDHKRRHRLRQCPRITTRAFIDGHYASQGPDVRTTDRKWLFFDGYVRTTRRDAGLQPLILYSVVCTTAETAETAETVETAETAEATRSLPDSLTGFKLTVSCN